MCLISSLNKKIRRRLEEKKKENVNAFQSVSTNNGDSLSARKRISSMNDNGLTRTYIHSYAERYVNDSKNKVLCSLSLCSRHWNVQLCVCVCSAAAFFVDLDH